MSTSTKVHGTPARLLRHSTMTMSTMSGAEGQEKVYRDKRPIRSEIIRLKIHQLVWVGEERGLEEGRWRGAVLVSTTAEH